MTITRVATDDGGIAASTAISLAEAKAHLNVLHDDDDSYITALLSVVQDHMEGAGGTGGALGRTVTQGMFELSVSGWGDGIIRLPHPPVTAVSWVKYRDTGGTLNTLSSDLYEVVRDDVQPAVRRLSTVSWPTLGDFWDAVQVRFTAGYTSVPPALKHALLLHLGHLYANRESVGENMAEVPMAYKALTGPYRAHGWI